jgi:hypothetical protein
MDGIKGNDADVPTFEHIAPAVRGLRNLANIVIACRQHNAPQ